MNQSQWSAALLQRLGIRQTPGALRAVVGWARAEGGHWNNSARFNPLNTTQPAPGAGNTGAQGNIKVYTSWDQGLNATVQTLRNGRYGGILAALRSGNPGAVGQAIAASPWGTGALAEKTIAGTKGGGSAQAPSAPSYGVSSVTTTTPARTTLNVNQAILDTLSQHPKNLAKSVLNKLAYAPQYTTHTPAKTATATMPSSGGGAQPTSAHGVAHLDGKPVAAWIANILQQAKAAGWTGTVSSGYRSVAEQARIYNSGVRPAAKPGQSNHNFTAFPGGAVDVTNAPQLARVLRKLGITKLQWAGAKDPVHFSHPHGGGY